MITTEVGSCSYCKKTRLATRCPSVVLVSFSEGSQLKKGAVRIAGFSIPLLPKVLKMSIVAALASSSFFSSSKN